MVLTPGKIKDIKVRLGFLEKVENLTLLHKNKHYKFSIKFVKNSQISVQIHKNMLEMNKK